MSRALTDIQNAKHLIPRREILDIEILETDDPDGEPGMIIYLPGMRIYCDSVTVYSDDSGDAPEAF